MSITDISEEIKAATCDLVTNDNGGSDGAGTREFIVIFNPNDPPENRPYLARDAAVQINNTRIPALWEVHPYDPFIFVAQKSVKMFGGPFSWLVSVKYSEIKDPLAEDYTVDWLFADTMEPIDKDRLGAALVNSSDEPFDPPLQEDFNDIVLRISRNESTYSPIKAEKYKKSLNQAKFLWFDPFTVRCTLYEARRIRYAGQYYYQVNYEFKIRHQPDAGGDFSGWKRRILDQGLREKTGTDSAGKPTYALITDDNGKAITQPVKLDGSGSKLAAALDPVFLSFETRNLEDYNQFNFNTTDPPFGGIVV